MLTKNYRQLALSRFTSTNFGTKSSNGGSYKTWTPVLNELTTQTDGQVSGKSRVSMRIGSGTTTPTYEDYKLESPIELAPSSISRTADESYLNGYIAITALFVNTTDAEITVSESAITFAISGVTSQGYGILAREVFDPIVVPVGSSVTITMTIS